VGNREGKTLGLVDDGAMVGAEEELGLKEGNVVVEAVDGIKEGCTEFVT
jgi:hypothetical protein